MNITDALYAFNLVGDERFYEISRNPEYGNLKINIIVITGGPCAGKTDTVNILRERSMYMNGRYFFFSSEAAERLIKENITYRSCGSDSTFQYNILDAQITDQRIAVISAIKYKIAHPYDDVFCIFDRGLMDGEAYFDNPEDYAKILQKYGLTREKVYARYDSVIYLQSAANGAEPFYKQTVIRGEPIELAKVLDVKVRQAWAPHPNFHAVLNQTDGKRPRKIFKTYKAKLAFALTLIYYAPISEIIDGVNTVSYVSDLNRDGGYDYNDSALFALDCTSCYLNYKTPKADKYEIRILESRGRELALLIYYKMLPYCSEDEESLTQFTREISVKEALELITQSKGDNFIVKKKSFGIFDADSVAIFSKYVSLNGIDEPEMGYLEIHYNDEEKFGQITEKLSKDFEVQTKGNDEFPLSCPEPEYLMINGLYTQ